MESFVVLSLYLKRDVIFETVSNLKPFLNISEEDGILYHRIILVLKLLFAHHFLQTSAFPNYVKHALFALGNAHFAFKYPSLAIWSAIFQCVLVAAPSGKAALLLSLVSVAAGTSMNIRSYEFILDALVLLSMTWYAGEAYRKEIQKLATVISILLTLGWYICSLSVFGVWQFCLVAFFLLLTYLPLMPNRPNEHRNRLLFFYGLMFVWIVYRWQSAHHHGNQILPFQAKNIGVAEKKWGHYPLKGNDSSTVLENFAALVENDFGKEPSEKSVKGSLKTLDEALTNSTFETELSKEVCTANSESKKASEEDYAPDKHGKIFENQNILQDARGNEEKDENNENNFKCEERNPVASIYSAEINEYAVGDTLDSPDMKEEMEDEIRTKEEIMRTEFTAREKRDHEEKDETDDKNFKCEERNPVASIYSAEINKYTVGDSLDSLHLQEEMENEIGTKEETMGTESTTREKHKSSSNVDHEVESNLILSFPFKLLVKDKINTEGEFKQNKLSVQEELKSTNINHEKELPKDEFNMQELKLLEDEIKTEKESMKIDSTTPRKETKSIDHGNELAKDVSNLQEFEITENETGKKDESEKKKFNTQEGLKSKIIVGEEKQFAEVHSDLRDDSKKIGEKNLMEGFRKEENSLLGAAQKFPEMKVDESNSPKESQSIDIVRTNAGEIFKTTELVSHLETHSNNEKRKLDTEMTATEESTTKMHTSKYIKREDYNFIENYAYLINEEMHENDFTTEADVIEDLPVTESYETATSETEGDQEMYLIYRHRRGKYYIL